MDDISTIRELLPARSEVLRHLRTHQDYKQWKNITLRMQFPCEAHWLDQFSSGGREILFDLLEDYFPPDFKLTERQAQRDWSYAAEFMIVVMGVIKRERLTDTSLILQRGRGQDENPVLVRSVLGEFMGRMPINAGIR